MKVNEDTGKWLLKHIISDADGAAVLGETGSKNEPRPGSFSFVTREEWEIGVEALNARREALVEMCRLDLAKAYPDSVCFRLTGRGIRAWKIAKGIQAAE